MQIKSRLAFAASLIVLTLIGCSDDGLSGSAESITSPSLSKAIPSDRPWSGECDVAAVFTSATELLIRGTCELAHLGRTTMFAVQTIDPTSIPIAYTNATTYTAANGDELRTTDIGTATPNTDGLTLSGAVTVIGGTGRFVNASGDASLSGAVRFTGPASTAGKYSLTGRVTY